MASLPCADRCPVVADLIAQHAHDDLSQRSARVSIGLTPVYVPVAPQRTVCEGCGHVWDSAEAAKACAAYDDTTD